MRCGLGIRTAAVTSIPASGPPLDVEGRPPDGPNVRVDRAPDERDVDRRSGPRDIGLAGDGCSSSAASARGGADRRSRRTAHRAAQVTWSEYPVDVALAEQPSTTPLGAASSRPTTSRARHRRRDRPSPPAPSLLRGCPRLRRGAGRVVLHADEMRHRAVDGDWVGIVEPRVTAPSTDGSATARSLHPSDGSDRRLPDRPTDSPRARKSRGPRPLPGRSSRSR